MTTTYPRLLRRVLTAAVATMIVAGVIAMHSFMVGHGPMTQPEQTSGAAAQHANLHQTMVMAAHAPVSDPAPILLVSALTGLTSATAHQISAMCLAVLPAMALLVVLALLRQQRRQGMVPSRREVPHQWVGIRGSPPRRTTLSLSQLGVLRA